MAEVSYPMTADPSQHRQELIERLVALRRNESFCDVTVSVKGKEFKAHKPVLAAASPFFLSLLESDMRESKEQLIKIELEEATATVMEDVLRYIYTGNVSVTEESCHNLIATADYLLMSGSIPKAIIPPPGQTPGHLTFFKKCLIKFPSIWADF